MNIHTALSVAGMAVVLALLSAAVSVLTVWSRALLRNLVMPLFALSGGAALVAGVAALLSGSSASVVLPLGLP